MNDQSIGLVIVMVAYLLMMVLIGILYSRKNSSASDFYLGGRKLGPLVTAMSAEASDMSSWLLMGLPGLAYVSGCSVAGWTAIGLAVGTYLNWLFVSKRLRRYSQISGNSITIPEFFKNRYRDKSNALLIISTIIIVIFFIPYTASGFAACGKLFSQLFHADYQITMLVSAVIIVSYTTLGGFLAASTTDLIQSFIMTIALVIVVVFGLSQIGGIGQMVQDTQNMDGYLSLTRIFDVKAQQSTPNSVLNIISTLAWGLGYFGMPHILLRFMGIEDEKKLTLSRRIATVWVVIAMSVAIFIGIMGYSMSKAGVVCEFYDQAGAETLMIQIAFLLSNHGIVLLVMGGLILAGMLACTMSTSDSQLLVASSCISQNLLSDWLKIQLSPKKSLLVARVSVLIIACLSALLALDPNSSVFRIVSFAWAGFGATFGPTMLLALFWKRSNMPGALAGMIAGGIMVFLWKFYISSLDDIFAIYELLPAFLFGLVVNVVTCLLTQVPSKEIEEEFESIQRNC